MQGSAARQRQWMGHCDGGSKSSSASAFSKNRINCAAPAPISTSSRGTRRDIPRSRPPSIVRRAIPATRSVRGSRIGLPLSPRRAFAALIRNISSTLASETGSLARHPLVFQCASGFLGHRGLTETGWPSTSSRPRSAAGCPIRGAAGAIACSARIGGKSSCVSRATGSASVTWKSGTRARNTYFGQTGRSTCARKRNGTAPTKVRPITRRVRAIIQVHITVQWVSDAAQPAAPSLYDGIALCADHPAGPC
jgi:hypothetical protein